MNKLNYGALLMQLPEDETAKLMGGVSRMKIYMYEYIYTKKKMNEYGDLRT